MNLATAFNNIPMANPVGPVYQIRSPESAPYNWWNFTNSIVHISRSSIGEPVIILATPPGAVTPVSHQFIEFNPNWNFNNGSTTSQMDCIVARFPSTTDGWHKTHQLLNALQNQINAGQTSEQNLVNTLYDTIATILPLNGMTNSEIIGLYGELHLLERLLTHGASSNPTIPPVQVFRCWKGHEDVARRDFVRTGRSQVIEVKTTSRDSRHHIIGNPAQLMPAAGVQPVEEVFVYSLQARLDSSGNDSLSDIINRIKTVLSPLDASGNQTNQPLLNQFDTALSNYGNSGYVNNAYHNRTLLVSADFLPHFYPAAQLSIPNSGTNPNGWTNCIQMQYVLDLVNGNEMTQAEEDTLFTNLVC